VCVCVSKGPSWLVATRAFTSCKMEEFNKEAFYRVCVWCVCVVCGKRADTPMDACSFCFGMGAVRRTGLFRDFLTGWARLSASAIQSKPSLNWVHPAKPNQRVCGRRKTTGSQAAQMSVKG
jgi:hypothetical protein